jgi:pyruvate dehydrogenase E1 component alpha subunit
MSTRIVDIDIRCTSFLDKDGAPIAELPDFADDETLIAMYRGMALTRAYDQKAVNLQRTGRLGTVASSLGQEAVGVGVASAMRVDDVLLPSFREQGAMLWRGVTMEELFLYWGGDERGSDFAGPRGDFPISIPVASHYPHAAGVALAMQLEGGDRVAVAMGGDGSTSKGDFYEALNLVGAWRLPAVFVISNNQWAISVPRSAQTAAETLAQKAVAAGIPGEQVDGNDVIAVRAAMNRALARARAGEGGTLIEALTYRLSDHTTADDAARYRDDEEVGAHWEQEPLLRLRNLLVARKAWSKEDEEALIKACAAEVDAAAEAYEATAPQDVSAIFEFTYETPPAELLAQRDAGGGS